MCGHIDCIKRSLMRDCHYWEDTGQVTEPNLIKLPTTWQQKCTNWLFMLPLFLCNPNILKKSRSVCFFSQEPMLWRHMRVCRGRVRYRLEIRIIDEKPRTSAPRSRNQTVESHLPSKMFFVSWSEREFYPVADTFISTTGWNVFKILKATIRLMDRRCLKTSELTTKTLKADIFFNPKLALRGKIISRPPSHREFSAALSFPCAMLVVAPFPTKL